MKYRKGFVTNSSSSSFICDYSGEYVDINWGNIGYCKNGHNFDSYNMSNSTFLEILLNYIDKCVSQLLHYKDIYGDNLTRENTIDHRLGNSDSIRIVFNGSEKINKMTKEFIKETGDKIKNSLVGYYQDSDDWGLVGPIVDWEDEYQIVNNSPLRV